MHTVLLRTGGMADASHQLRFDFGAIERQLETSWDSAHEKARESRTIFAQRRLRPQEVLPEWHKAVAVLGGADDVRRFVRLAAERLHAPLEPVKTVKSECYRLPVGHLPLSVRERLAAVGIDKPYKLTFTPPAPVGVTHVHRAHPLVAALAEYVAERALTEEVPDLAARSGAIFTDAVCARTTVYLLRLRSQLTVETLDGNRVQKRRDLLAEECLSVTPADSALETLTDVETARLWAAVPSRNMVPEQRQRQIAHALTELEQPQLARSLAALAEQRAQALYADHTRVRAASSGRGAAPGTRYRVTPCLPVDVIGVYVLIPTPTL